MNRIKSLILITSLAFASLAAYGGEVQFERKGGGLGIGTSTGDLITFYGGTPTAQPSGVGQSALTDSTGGTAATTLAAGTGISTLTIPIQLSSMTTSAAELTSAITLGYKFKILSADFVTTTIGAGAGASQTISLKIGSTAVTGGVVNPTLTGTNTLGKLVAGTSVTAANTGTASDTLTVAVAASGTVFSAGAGYLVIRVQNMDTADTAASIARLAGALRTALGPTKLNMIAGQ